MSITSILVKDIDEDLKKSLSEYDYFEPSSPATMDIGGIEKGWFPDNGKIKIQEFLDKLIHPAEPPKVSITVSPVSALREMGDAITTVSISVTIEKTTLPIASLEVFKNNQKIYSKTSELENGGTFVCNDNEGIQAPAIYKVVVTDGQESIEKIFNYDFVYAMYIGAIDKDINTITQDDIKMCEKRVVLKNSQVKSFSHYGKRVVFAYPKTYGNLKEIKDMNGFILNGFTQKTLTIQNDYNQSTSYNVYIANEVSDLSNYSIHFEF